MKPDRCDMANKNERLKMYCTKCTKQSTEFTFKKKRLGEVRNCSSKQVSVGNRDVELWKYEVLMEVTVDDRWADSSSFT